MQRISYFLALPIMLVLLMGSLYGQSRAIQVLNTGRNALETGDYSAAQQELEYCIKLNPTTPYVYAFLAKAYYFQSELDRAIYAFNKSLETDYVKRANGMVELVFHNAVSLTLAEQQNLNPAVMHYQRGRIHHLKGNEQMATKDMEKALAINPYYEDAKLYLAHIRSGKGPLLIQAPITSEEVAQKQGKNERRPESSRAEKDENEDYVELRKARSIYYRIDKPRRRSEKAYLTKAEDRKIKDGMRIYNPKVAYATQDYIKIESIIFSSTQTIVSFEIENPSKDSSYTLRLDNGLMITERTGGQARSFRMERLSDFNRNGTQLKPGAKLRFYAIFPTIPSSINYVNIIEGTRHDGQEWNFYDVQLFE